MGDPMARSARKNQMTSIYAVDQSTEQILFRNDNDRQVMIEIIKEAQRKYGFHCYAFCLLSDHGFKIILDVADKNISSILSSISIAYALYRKAEHKLFTKRFKSTPLYSKEEVVAQVRKVNRQTDSKFNSFCFYDKSADDSLDWIVDINQKNIHIVKVKKTSDIEVAHLLLEEWMKQQGCCVDDLTKDKQLRNMCIARLHKETNCSMKQLGVLFGGISESTISKILKENEQ
jgi:REP element-mobilizing transposase RayT